MANDKPLYDDSHKKMYEKIINIVPLEQTIASREIYDGARLEALGHIKGKRAKSYDSGIEILTDALIKFRKGAKHPHASDNKDHRHHYVNEVRDYLNRYAEANKLDKEGMDKMIKSGKLRVILESILTAEEESNNSSKIEYEMRKLIPEKEADYKGIAEYHISQNPEFKKALSKSKLARFKTDRDTLLAYLKGHYEKNLETKLNDYEVPDIPKKK